MKKYIKMYDNKYKNISTTSIEGLDVFIQLIADLDEEIELFAMGGTAMVLANIKEATRDIDFLTNSDQVTIQRLFNLAGLKEKDTSKLCNKWNLNDETRIDIFYDGFILGVPLPNDWGKMSIHVKTVGKVKLFILNWHDVIITKLSRSEERDIEDIVSIIKSEKINIKTLKKRYYNLAETALISDYDKKFKHLEKKLK